MADDSPARIKAQVQGRRVSFVTDRQLTEADFADLPVTSLRLDDSRVELLSNQPGAVLQEMFRRGVGLRDLSVVGADLEEAFLSLTSRHPVTSDRR